MKYTLLSSGYFWSECIIITTELNHNIVPYRHPTGQSGIGSVSIGNFPSEDFSLPLMLEQVKRMMLGEQCLGEL